MSLKIGALFAGYGGLDLAVSSVLDAQPAWFSEFDKGPSKILAHRFPNVPNHGDITRIDWATVEPVDIITGGSPCQDLSHAGRRAGMTEGTRSNLWVAMREAIAQLRPRLVVWENVRGAYSAAADSAVEPCPGCVGDGTGVHLRALGRVLGDLSDLGYDAVWHGLRAADIGAPHGRFRVFVVAYPAADPDGRLDVARIARADQRAIPHGDAGSPSAALLPTPSCSDTNGVGQHGDGGLDLRTTVAMLPTPQARDHKGYGPADRSRNDPNLSAIPLLLPTPAVNDMGEGKTVEKWDEWTAAMQAKHGNGNGHGKSLAIEAQRLLPTPTSSDSKASGGDPSTSNVTLTDAAVRGRGLLPTPSVADVQGGRKSRSGDRNGELLLNGIAAEDRWGDYAPAIARWEHALGRPAPEPTQTSKKGNPQLSARFVEWLMGLPAGWVTDVPGVTRNEALKALGNGVVPQQAAQALRVALDVIARKEAAC